MFKKIFFLTLLCHADWAFSMKNEEERPVPQSQNRFPTPEAMGLTEAMTGLSPEVMNSVIEMLYTNQSGVNPHINGLLFLNRLSNMIDGLNPSPRIQEGPRTSEQLRARNDFTQKAFSSSRIDAAFKYGWLLRNPDLFSIFENSQMPEADYSLVMDSFLCKHSERIYGLEYPNDCYISIFKYLKEQGPEEEIKFFRAFLDGNVMSADGLKKMVSFFIEGCKKNNPLKDCLINLPVEALLHPGIISVLKCIKREKGFPAEILPLYQAVQASVRSNIPQCFESFERIENSLDLPSQVTFQAGYLKDLDYLNSLKSVSAQGFGKVHPVALLLSCDPANLQHPITSFLNSLDWSGQAGRLVEKYFENYEMDPDTGPQVKAIYKKLQQSDQKAKIKELSSKEFDEQVQALGRLKLDEQGVKVHQDLLKALNPVATWEVFKNKGLLRTQLSEENRAKAAFTAARDPIIQNILVDTCIEGKLHLKKLPQLIEGFKLNQKNAEALESLALAANKKSSRPASKKPAPRDWDGQSEASYAPSSVPSLVNTEIFAQRLSQLHLDPSTPAVALEEGAAKFSGRISNWARTFEFEEEYSVVGDPAMASFITHIGKHIVNSDLERNLLDRKANRLSEVKDAGLIENLRLAEATGPTLTAFILPKNLGIKDDENAMTYFQSILTGATVVAETEKINEDQTAQTGISWEAAQLFEYFEFTKDLSQEGAFRFQKKEGRCFVGALDTSGNNPCTIYPVAAPKIQPEIKPETEVSELAEEMERFSLSSATKKEEMKRKAPKGFKKEERR
jgi:hypothetical protein